MGTAFNDTDGSYMSQDKRESSTIASKLRAEIVALLVKELGYELDEATRLVVRHEGLMLKAVGRNQPIGPIALAIHLAHERENQPAA
jgi:hypothetical protein